MKKLFLVVLIFLAFSSKSQIFGQANQNNLTPGGYLESIFDHYGNKYEIEDIRINPKKKKGKNLNNEFVNKSTLLCSSGIFDLYFEAGSGMDNASNPMHISRRNVVCQVFQDISDFINTPLKNPGNTSRVKIWVRDINSVTSSNGVLGLASAFYNVPSNSSAGFGGIADNEIWKTIHVGRDSYFNVVPPVTSLGSTVSGLFYHGMVAVNFNNNSINWNTNLSVVAPNGTYDLYSVVLHEVTHALGFASLINENGQSKFGSNYNYFSRYDTFLKNANQSDFLITNLSACSTMYNYGYNSGLNTSILHPGCTLSGNVYNGSLDSTQCGNEINYVGGNGAIPVYTPQCFETGSSLSHFEDQIYPTCNPTNNNLYFAMSNSNGQGVSGTKRYLKIEERQVLCDVGYNVKTEYGNSSQLSYKNYGVGNCAGVDVAGINDGINLDGTYTFLGNIGSAISISGILANDYTSNSADLRFECLEDVYAPATIFPTSGDASSVVTFSSSSPGLHLLRYVPYNFITGKRGNITYVYVYVTSFGSPTPTSCNLVMNGDFEQNYSVPSFMGQINLSKGWLQTNNASPDYFNATSTNNNVKIPCNSYGFQECNNSNGNSYAGMINYHRYDWDYQYSESIVTKLATPLLPNSTYQLSFDVSLAEGMSSFSNKLQAYFSTSFVPSATPGDIAISNPSMLFTNPSFSTTSNGWERITFAITTGATAGEQYLYLGGLNNVQIAPNTPVTVNNCSYTNMNGPGTDIYNMAGYYIDNVSLVAISNAPDLSLPQTICQNQPNLNLNSYLSYIPNNNGTFTGVGVSQVGSDYVFSPTVAGVGTHTITYTFQSNTGCPFISVTDTVTVLPSCVHPYISQTYVYGAEDKFIEVKNADDTQEIAPGNYYLALYQDGASTANAPTSFIDLGTIPAQGVKVFKNPTAVAPVYALGSADWSGLSGFDGNNDLVILTTTTDANAYANRVDVFGDTTNIGTNTSLVRISCAPQVPRIDTFDEQDWVAFTDTEVSDPASKTNAVLGRHFDKLLFWEPTNTWNEQDIIDILPAINESMPDRSRQIKMNSDYCTGTNSANCTIGFGSFEACSLEIGSFVTLTITPSTHVKVQIAVNVLQDGQLIIDNQGSLIMVRDCYYGVCGTDLIDLGANSTMQATNQTVSLDGPYDYVYWSSPLSLNSANKVANDIFPFGTGTGQFNPSRFYLFQNQYFCDIYRQYNTAISFVDGYDDNFNDYMPFTHPELVAANAMTSHLIPGRGYATWPPIGNTNYSVTFTGEMNNGIVTVPVYRNNSEKGKNENLVGNPYPSPIDLNVLFAENSTVIQPIAYIWTRLTDDPSGGNPGPNGLNYTAANFSVFTTDMTLNTENNTVFAGGSTIATGQSFFVRTYKDFTGFANAPVAPINGAYNSSTTPEEILLAGNVVFKNKMRTTAPNTTFSRMSNNAGNMVGSNENPGDKLWVNLTDTDNYAVQLGVCFKPTGSEGFIEGEDTSTIHGRKYNFYTQSTTEDLIIDVQNSFSEEKIIPLGIVNTSQNQQQSFTISIPKRTGVFETQTVYLEDTQLGIVHNLSQSGYSFTTNGSVIEGRFQLRFTNNSSTFINRKAKEHAEVTLYVENDAVIVLSLNKKIKTVEVFDIYSPSTSGLLLAKTENSNVNEARLAVKSNFILLNVKIILEDGTIINKKVRR